MNFVFISPQFPHTYWNFCDRLRQSGVNVLGIGDSPYEELEDCLKAALTEYYRVDSLEDYDEVVRAMGFYTFKYGRIDWVESNNEYWLAQDAGLRTDFNICTGVKRPELEKYKSKSAMKPYYAKAGVPTARCHKITTLKAAFDFIAQVGYPVIVKPDVGVGANDTYKLEDEAAVRRFFEESIQVPYVMEEFVEGDICSYDVITDSHCRPLFESMTVWPPSIMDIVNEKLDLAYYTAAEVPEKLRKCGRATVEAFDVKSRFVHLEFFRLKKAKKGLGEAGDFVGLEVNMRPAGGYTPDMMNFAHSTDVYQIWADMVTEDRRILPDSGKHHFCIYASRRSCYQYVHSHEEILEKYGDRIKMCERMPQLMHAAMGEQMYTAYVDDAEQVEEFIQFVHEKRQDGGDR